MTSLVMQYQFALLFLCHDIQQMMEGLNLTKEVTKTKKARFIPLDDTAWQTLMDWLEQTKESIGIRFGFPRQGWKK